MNSSPRLLLPDAYLKCAIDSINKAERRVNLLVMVMADDAKTLLLVDALCAAAQRDVSVNVAVDMFTYAEIGGHLRFHTKRNKHVEPATRLERRLKDAGVNFRWLGTSGSSIFSGRTHSKWLIVDDTVYAFGGINLFQRGLEHTDFMFELHDSALAERLAQEQSRIITADKNDRVYRSHKFETTTGVVMIDGGLTGESIIYRRVCELAKKASRVTYVSQYCPTGQLGRLLKKTGSTLYFNPWNKADSFNALVIRVGSVMSGHESIYTGENYLHAKLMLFEFADGRKVAVCGSHNFSHGGVWLGTREIALETTNSSVINQLENFIKDQVT